jgi:hypothetical protein
VTAVVWGERFARNIRAPIQPIRVALLVSTGALLVLSIASLVIFASQPANLFATLGVDYDFFVRAARRFVDGQGFYLERQLAGPYTMSIGIDTLYPPTALFLFVPFLVLPAVLWWAIPLGILGYTTWRWRPAMWTWPFLAFAVWWPRDMSMMILGSTGMWVAALVAAGLMWGWAGPLILFKPTLAPFALAGFPRRAWWVGAGLALVASAVTLPLWPDYITAMLNGSGLPPIPYTLPDLPLMFVPIVAWVGRRQTPDQSVRQFGHDVASG